MIIVSHHINFIKNLASRVLFPDDGVISPEGSVEEFFSNAKNMHLKRFLNMVNEVL